MGVLVTDEVVECEAWKIGLVTALNKKCFTRAGIYV